MLRFFGRVAGIAATALLALASSGALAQERVTVWFTRAFYPAEDQALQDVIKKYEAKSGVKVDLSLYSPEDIVTKSVAAVEAGNPPDVGFGLTYASGSPASGRSRASSRTSTTSSSRSLLSTCPAPCRPRGC